MLYQRTQATASRSTSPIAPGAGVAGALPVADEFCFVQGVQRLGQGVNPFKQKTDTQTIKHAPWLILHGCSAIAAPLTLSAHTWSSFARTPGIEGYSYPPTMKQSSSMLIFPHQQAEKSLQNQHVLPILQVGSHHLQYRLSRTSKPKSCDKTNTFYFLTLARSRNSIEY